MNYQIYKDKEPVNTIVADPEFIDAYCNEYGYTYELIPLSLEQKMPDNTQYTDIQLLGQQITNLELLVLDTLARESGGG